MNTKQKILDTSRSLFNDFGFPLVTIRMIASALNMSSGNLNYHFRKREDILEALYFEMVKAFDARVQELPEKNISLLIMKSEIQSSMERMIDYRFFWTDLYYLLQANEQIKAHFLKVKSERVDGYKLVFKSLIDQEILNQPSSPKEYQYLIDRMIDYSNTWLYASQLYEGKQKSKAVIELASFQLLSMLFPYLTSLGREEFESHFPTFLA